MLMTRIYKCNNSKHHSTIIWHFHDHCYSQKCSLNVFGTHFDWLAVLIGMITLWQHVHPRRIRTSGRHITQPAICEYRPKAKPCVSTLNVSNTQPTCSDFKRVQNNQQHHQKESKQRNKTKKKHHHPHHVPRSGTHIHTTHFHAWHWHVDHV